MADDGRIENSYRLHVLNADRLPHRYTLQATGLPALQVLGNPTLAVGAGDRASVTVTLQLAGDAGSARRGHAQPITLTVRRDDGRSVETQARFFVPR